MIHIKQAAEQQSYVDFTLLLYSSHQLTIIKRPVDVDTSLVSQVHCIGNIPPLFFEKRDLLRRPFNHSTINLDFVRPVNAIFV